MPHNTSLTPAYRHILVPTDFSPHAGRAAARAIDLANHYNANLTVLHCIEDLLLYNDWADPLVADLPLNHDALQHIADQQLRQFAEDSGLVENNAHLLTEWGSPKWTIIETARTRYIDLIVMGTHGHRGIERLLGSVSSGVSHHAPCDILLVHEAHNLT